MTLATFPDVRTPRIGLTTSPTIFDGRTHEAVQRPYVESVLRAGGIPLMLPVLSPDAAPDVLGGLDGLVLTGGGDIDPARYGQEPVPEVYGVDPDRDAWEFALVAHAEIPILGICRGLQVLNVAHGGSLIQHLGDVTSVEHRERDRPEEVIHGVFVEPGTRLENIIGGSEFWVNTLHHQAVDELGDGLIISALADDGTVEAIERPDRPIVGVQWHPELLPKLAPNTLLFEWVVAEAALGTRQGSVAAA